VGMVHHPVALKQDAVPIQRRVVQRLASQRRSPTPSLPKLMR
jgi:hypothetical protein